MGIVERDLVRWGPQARTGPARGKWRRILQKWGKAVILPFYRHDGGAWGGKNAGRQRRGHLPREILLLATCLRSQRTQPCGNKGPVRNGRITRLLLPELFQKCIVSQAGNAPQPGCPVLVLVPSARSKPSVGSSSRCVGPRLDSSIEELPRSTLGRRLGSPGDMCRNSTATRRVSRVRRRRGVHALQDKPPNLPSELEKLM